MAYLNWENSYSVGVSKIDEQHKKLFQYLNDLHEAMKAGKSKEILGGLINELINYTKAHFSLEEELMKKNNYPGFLTHQAEHKKFTDKVMDIKTNSNLTSGIVSIEIMSFLKDWLVNHVLKTDKKYEPFFSGKGIK